MSAVLATLLPLLVAALATGVFGMIFGPQAAGAAIILAFATAYLSILGWPMLPPQSSLQKIIVVALAGFLLGIVLNPASCRRWIRPVAVIWPGVIVAWIGSWQFAGLGSLDLAMLVVLWLIGAVLFDRLAAMSAAAIDVPTMLLAAGVGASLVAFLGAAASLGQLAAATAAATGGFLLWNWPKRRYPFSIPTLYGTASTLFAVVVATVLFTRASVLALAILLLILGVGIIRERVLFIERPVIGPIAFGVACAIPMFAAVAVAYLMAAEPAM